MISLLNDKETLYQKYIDEKKSLVTIGKECGVAYQTVYKWLIKHGIKTRPYSTRGFKFPGRKLTEKHKEQLRVWHTGRKLKPETIEKMRNKVVKSGKENPMWKGGRYLCRGYYIVNVGVRKNRKEHRVVMENFLGRKLNREEHVHHINGIKSDNRIENLQLVSNYEHAMIHWKNPERRISQSEKMQEARKNKFWNCHSLAKG